MALDCQATALDGAREAIATVGAMTSKTGELSLWLPARLWIVDSPAHPMAVWGSVLISSRSPSTMPDGHTHRSASVESRYTTPDLSVITHVVRVGCALARAVIE